MITEHQKKELQKICMREPILIAYLFGSLAKGQERKESDADIAVHVSPVLSKEQRFALRLKIMERTSRVLKRITDVVMLNDIVSPFFKYVIITEGVVLYQKSEIHRIEIESNIYTIYFDFQPFLQNYTHHYVAHHQ
ncbi:MAG: nucleotidyltransferase domain-containing protein [bacterium]|nr:nucleotidyltransferase domain-containing protein [bacterium]